MIRSSPSLARASLLACALWSCAAQDAAALQGAGSLTARAPLPEAAPAPGEPARSSAPAVASYTLRARLDAELHEIQGEGEIHWLNSSTRPTDELYLHLYLN